MGSVGDSTDNALAESIIALYKAEVIHPRGRWRGLEPVEFGTREWVHWFNRQRLMETIRNRPPVERCDMPDMSDSYPSVDATGILSRMWCGHVRTGMRIGDARGSG